MIIDSLPLGLELDIFEAFFSLSLLAVISLFHNGYSSLDYFSRWDTYNSSFM